MPAKRALFVLIVTSALLAATVGAAEPDTDSAEKLAGGLEQPVDLAFGPDGELLFAELMTGNVRALRPNGTTTDVLAHVDASPGGNGGFTGLAVDPEDAETLFVFYSIDKPDATNGKVNRVSRLDLADDTETVLLDDIGWADLHEGGRVAVGADGVLYVTTGDNDLKDVSQDDEDVLGKVLRMTRDGAPAPGNPEGWHPLAWAKGFRNPFGLEVLDDGRVFVSDNGGKHDEVDLVLEGRNYGWPMCSGPCNASGTEDPVASWTPPFGPTGLSVVGDTAYVGDFVYTRVRTVDLESGETGVLWEGGGGGVLDVEDGPDGCLYVSTWEGIWRIPLEDATCELADPEQDFADVGDGGDDPAAGEGNVTDPPSNGTLDLPGDDQGDAFEAPGDDTTPTPTPERGTIPAPAALVGALAVAAAAVLRRR